MLMDAPYSCGCRGCGGEIATGEQISWVDPNGPFHRRCTPIVAERDGSTPAPAEAPPAPNGASAASPAPAAAANGSRRKGRGDKLRVPANRPAVAVVSPADAGRRRARTLSLALAVALVSSSLFGAPVLHALLGLLLCVACAALALRAWRRDQGAHACYLAAVALVYNPMLPVLLPFELWLPLDLLSAWVLLMPSAEAEAPTAGSGSSA